MLASSFAGLYVLAALACPVGMGLMMVFMGKGMLGGKTREQLLGELSDQLIDRLLDDFGEIAVARLGTRLDQLDATRARKLKGARRKT